MDASAARGIYISKAFTADGVSEEFTVPAGGVGNYVSTGTFTGILTLERIEGSGSTSIATSASSGSQISGSLENLTRSDQRYRVRMTGQASGTATVVIGAGPRIPVGEMVPFILDASYTTIATAPYSAHTDLQELPGMVFAYGIGDVYTFTLHAMTASAAATTGHAFAFDVTSTVGKVNLTFFHQLANTGTLSGGSSIADAAAVGVSSGVPTGGTDVPSFGGGILIATTNAGAAKLQFRSETTAAATLVAGSTLIVRRVR